MARTLLIVALGGGIGSALRFLLSKLVAENAGGTFPYPTLAVNIVGCLAIGLFYGMSVRGHLGGNTTKTLLTTGLCGGFTTFSTFCNENLSLLRDGHYLTALLYAGGSLALGLAAVAAGYWLAEHA